MAGEPLHPTQFIVEFFCADRIAVGQIERSDDKVADLGLDIAAMAVVRAIWQPRAPQRRRLVARQYGNPVKTLLTVPDAAIAGRFDIGDRQRFIGAFELLEADHVGLLALQPFDQPRQARANAVEVVSGEPHLKRRSSSRSRSPTPHWGWSPGTPRRRDPRRNRPPNRAPDRG